MRLRLQATRPVVPTRKFGDLLSRRRFAPWHHGRAVRGSLASLL